MNLPAAAAESREEERGCFHLSDGQSSKNFSMKGNAKVLVLEEPTYV